MKKFYSVGLSVLMAMGLTACQSHDVVGHHPMINDTQQAHSTIMANQSLNQQLVIYDWQLVSAIDNKKQNIKEITSLNKAEVTLSFSNQKTPAVGFSVGCNNMWADYQLVGNELSVINVMSTQMYCMDLNDAEQRLGKLMTGTSTLIFSDSQAQNQQTASLVQTTADGSRLIWQGKLTDQSKYGEGQTMFLEVAPQMQQCPNGMNQQCLKVREVYYDDNWIKSGYSDWRLFDKPIDGYSHEAGLRKVLRIKQYVTNPEDVKGKQPIYVLDMVVETELASR